MKHTEDSPTPMERLAGLARAGDAGALDELLCLSRPGLMRLASSLVRDRDAAQDIVQETMLSLHLSIAQLLEPAAFWTWAQTILRREAFDYFRTEKRYQHDSVECCEAAAGSGPDESVESQLLKQEMDFYMNRLRKDDLNLLGLFYWRDFEVGEIAETLGIAVGAVKVRLFRARNRLRELLMDSDLELYSH
jgi:RNA polymerase sigma-70 factor (ECF subfamily)